MKQKLIVHAKEVYSFPVEVEVDPSLSGQELIEVAKEAAEKEREAR